MAEKRKIPYRRRVEKWFCPVCGDDFWEREGAEECMREHHLAEGRR